MSLSQWSEEGEFVFNKDLKIYCIFAFLHFF